MKNINDILDKYLSGETSLAEEQELKKYFASTKNIPTEMLWAKTMFAGFGEMAKDTMPVKNKKLYRRRLRIVSIISSAAVVALAFTLTMTLRPSETIYCYVNGEPVTELAVAQRQVAMISRIATSSERVILSNVETIEQVSAQSNVIDKAMKYLDLIRN